MSGASSLSDAESYWEQIWGRKLPRMGEHSIYMQAEAYNNMVRSEREAQGG